MKSCIMRAANTEPTMPPTYAKTKKSPLAAGWVGVLLVVLASSAQSAQQLLAQSFDLGDPVVAEHRLPNAVLVHGGSAGFQVGPERSPDAPTLPRRHQPGCELNSLFGLGGAMNDVRGVGVRPQCLGDGINTGFALPVVDPADVQEVAQDEPGQKAQHVEQNRLQVSQNCTDSLQQLINSLISFGLGIAAYFVILLLRSLFAEAWWWFKEFCWQLEDRNARIRCDAAEHPSSAARK
jgi:hypothetical protein